MTLLDLVDYFRTGGHFEAFCRSQSLNIESEAIEVYMQKSFSIKKPLYFFEIEETRGSAEYTSNSVTYCNLFDLHYFLDAIEESKSGEATSLTNEVIANRLLEYAINDA